MMFTTVFSFNKRYFIFFILLLLIEILIARYVDDQVIRPYAGDYLVVILLYCLLRGFVKIRVITAAVSVLGFSILIESLQYFKLADKLGLAQGSLSRIILGDYFSWIDIFTYTLGIITVLCFERSRQEIYKH
jgi:Protein of unknown function (DUF2809)